MKIAFFLPHGTKGGAEQFILQVAKECDRRGFELTFFFLTNKNIDQFEGEFEIPKERFIISPVESERYGFLLAPFYFLYYFRSSSFDIILSSHVHLNGLLGFFRKLKLIHTEIQIARESTQVFKRYIGSKLKLLKLFYRLGYKYIDVLICQTEEMRIGIQRNLPWLKQPKLVVLPNPINLIEVHEKREVTISGFDFPFIVAAGSLFPVKGFDILIRSFQIITNKYPDLHLIILGKGHMEKMLIELIKELGLQSKVHLLGWVANVYPYFRKTKCCVVSSLIEGFPNVILQQMACNDTLVATRCTDGLDNIPGLYLCNVNDVEALALALELALNSDNTSKRKIFNEYLNNNTIQTYVDKLIDYKSNVS